MFREAYKRKMDAVQPDASFRAALNERMNEKMNERMAGMNRRESGNARHGKMIVAVALLIALLITSAVAMVQGGLLRTEIEESAGETFAEKVQDVHASIGSEGFGFTIDEVVCEDDRMYLSYSTSVPDDGNTYLYALCIPKLNGEKMSYGYAFFYDDSFTPVAFPIGGEFGCQKTQVIPDIFIDSQIRDQAENLLEMRAIFFKANRDIKYAGEWEDYYAMMEKTNLQSEFGSSESFGDVFLMPNSDTLYYYGETAQENPSINLCDLPEYWQLWRGLKEDRALDAKEFASTEIVELIDIIEISIPIDASETTEGVYNDLAQTKFELDGFEIEFTDFRLSHFGASYSADIRTDEPIPDEYTGDELYSQFYTLLRGDGSELCSAGNSSFSSGNARRTDGGERVYRIDGDISGMIPVEALDTLLLAPEIFNDDGQFSHYDLENAIEIKPVYNPDKPEATPQPKFDFAENDSLSS